MKIYVQVFDSLTEEEFETLWNYSANEDEDEDEYNVCRTRAEKTERICAYQRYWTPTFRDFFRFAEKSYREQKKRRKAENELRKLKESIFKSTLETLNL